MSASFKFNPGFEADLKRMAADAGRRLAADLQRAIDNLRPQYEGHPVEEIRPALASAWAGVNDGAHIDEPSLTEYADAIRTGRGIDITYGGITK